MFLHLCVILSPVCHADPPGLGRPPRVGQTPPRSRPPLDAAPRVGQTPLGCRSPQVWADPPPRYGQQAGGTHPTGMHTCLIRKTAWKRAIDVMWPMSFLQSTFIFVHRKSRASQKVHFSVKVPCMMSFTNACIHLTATVRYFGFGSFVVHFLRFYRPKRSFGQGNIFTGVCLSTGGGACSKCSGGRGGACSKFSGGGACSKFLGRGGACSKFSGGGPAPKFRGGLQFSEYGQRSAGTHPTGMHSFYPMFLSTF